MERTWQTAGEPDFSHPLPMWLGASESPLWGSFCLSRNEEARQLCRGQTAFPQHREVQSHQVVAAEGPTRQAAPLRGQAPATIRRVWSHSLNHKKKLLLMIVRRGE